MAISKQAEQHFVQGGAHYTAGRLREAEADFRAAVALSSSDPTLEYALGLALLAQGRYAEGLPLFERRHEAPQLANRKPPLPYPEWRGEPVRGRRIVIWPEQGLGDQIQAARFAPILKRMGADVTLVCAPQLVRLFGHLGVQVIGASGAIEFPDPDGWVMCMSIPHRLGLDLATLPSAPYLSGPSVVRAAGPLRVGILTRGNPHHLNDAARSLPEDAAARLAALSVEIIDLHPAVTGAADFQDTAALVAGLDLVISVDTSVAHLAGAMGKPCWILLPDLNTDWRWMRGRTDSPWYASMTLFRQSVAGDWAGVFERVEVALASFGKPDR
jgi:tetratricopeptide (TPR) repeat protein